MATQMRINCTNLKSTKIPQDNELLWGYPTLFSQKHSLLWALLMENSQSLHSFWNEYFTYQ